MKRALWAVAAVAALAGCGPKYATNGPCVSDSDCTLCDACGCARVYAKSDIDTASCGQVTKDLSCVPEPSDCKPVGAYQALCVSGVCQAASR